MFFKELVKKNGHKLVGYGEAREGHTYVKVFDYSEKYGGTYDSHRYYNNYVVDVTEDEKSNSLFKKGDVVWAKKEFIDPHETREDTIGIVVEYNPDNDYLGVGTLYPQEYAIPPIFNGRGSCYELYPALTNQNRSEAEIKKEVTEFFDSLIKVFNAKLLTDIYDEPVLHIHLKNGRTIEVFHIKPDNNSNNHGYRVALFCNEEEAESPQFVDRSVISSVTTEDTVAAVHAIRKFYKNKI